MGIYVNGWIMFDINHFLACHKALLIAPAGYGKTHFIADTIKHCNGKILILTHTHAGVASLRQKLNKAQVPTDQYNLETISSFAQKYVHSYIKPDQIPALEEQNVYFKFIVQHAVHIFEKPIIQDMITRTYSGVFVDEYQDCTKSQHAMILSITRNITLRVLGDPLQGIFDFNQKEDPLVDFDEDLNGFEKFYLTTPWRWCETNPLLGNDLKYIRDCLETNATIDWSRISTINVTIANPGNLQQERSKYIYRVLNKVKEENLLIISEHSSARGVRLALVKQMGGLFQLVEAIDGKEFYSNAKILDSLNRGNFYSVFRDLCIDLFTKTAVNNWLGENRIKNKRNEVDKKKLLPLVTIFETADDHNLYLKMHDAIDLFRNFPQIRVIQHEQLYNLMSALQLASNDKVLPSQAMIQLRNFYRSKGRNIPHRAIGTTLLTKGLEFDNVIVLNPEAMDEKHFYVAITRACKRLFIYQEEN